MKDEKCSPATCSSSSDTFSNKITSALDALADIQGAVL
jgi:hypothetical protein